MNVSGGVSAYTYLWNNAGTLTSSTIANPVATPIAGVTNYTVDVERVADSHRVTDKDVALELLHLIGRDDAIFERAEAGGDAIGDGSALEQGLHRLSGSFHPLNGFCSDLHARRVGQPLRASWGAIRPLHGIHPPLGP